MVAIKQDDTAPLPDELALEAKLYTELSQRFVTEFLQWLDAQLTAMDAPYKAKICISLSVVIQIAGLGYRLARNTGSADVFRESMEKILNSDKGGV